MNGGRQKDVVLILARELASNIATPMLVLDAKGMLVFFNEPAEGVLGATFAATGETDAREWDSKWPVSDIDGNPVSLLETPLARVITERAPSHEVIHVLGLDGVNRRIEATVYPLFGSSHQFVGGVGVFWQVDQ